MISEPLHTRANAPGAIGGACVNRQRLRGTLFLLAVDHPARGALGVGDDPPAMADHPSLLDRLLTALANPEVDGLLATPDMIDVLLLRYPSDGDVDAAAAVLREVIR